MKVINDKRIRKESIMTKREIIKTLLTKQLPERVGLD